MLAMMLAALGLVAVAWGQLAGGDVQVRSARLLPSAQSARANAAPLQPPVGSAFLWVVIEVAKGDTVPVVLELGGVNASDGAEKRYQAFGYSPLESPVISTSFRPIGVGARGEAWLETYAKSSADGYEFQLNNDVGRGQVSAKLTLKKPPAHFSLFFVVPATTSPSYLRISGLAAADLRISGVSQTAIGGLPAPTTAARTPPDPLAIAQRRASVLARSVKLSDEQKSSVTGILARCHTARNQAPTPIESQAGQDLTQAFKSGDLPAMAQSAARLGGLAGRLIAIDAKADAEVFALLNDEQRAIVRKENTAFFARPMPSAAIARAGIILEGSQSPTRG